MCDAIVYLLCSEISSKTYIGYTTNLIQRLRRHNGEITGGARYTKQDRPWKCVLFVSGFKDKCDAMSFEWHAKHKKSMKNLTGSEQPEPGSLRQPQNLTRYRKKIKK